LTEVATQIHLPNSFHQFIDSSNTPLDPRNGNYKFFVYGMLPHTMTRFVAVVTSPDRMPPQLTTPISGDGTNPEYKLSKAIPDKLRKLVNPDGVDYTGDIHKVGRALSAFLRFTGDTVDFCDCTASLWREKSRLCGGLDDGWHRL
jgi:hypothetical protein